MLKKDDNLKERSLKLWKEIYYNSFEFDRYKILFNNIDKIKFEDVFQLFKNVFFENPSRVSIHQYSSNYDKNKVLKSNNSYMDYELNKNKKILLTNDLMYYKKQPFIQAYKTKRFVVKNILGENKNISLKKEGKSKKKSNGNSV